MANVSKRGGFELSQYSSRREVLRSLDAATRTHHDLNFDDDSVEPTLGLLWDCSGDAFVIRSNVVTGGKTKRELLQAISSIFDPL